MQKILKNFTACILHHAVMGDSKLLDGNQLAEKLFQIEPLLFRIAGCPIFQTKDSKFVFALAFIYFYMNFFSLYMRIAASVV
jgi:hypothetical protein